MTKDKYESRLAKIKERNMQKEYRRMLWDEYRKYLPKLKTPSTSKCALWAGFLLMAEIIVFCQYIALKTYDTTPLVAIIGAIGGWITMFYSYTKKSTVENSRNGIVFETAMMSNKSGDQILDEAVG